MAPNVSVWRNLPQNEETETEITLTADGDARVIALCDGLFVIRLTKDQAIWLHDSLQPAIDAINPF